MNGQDSGQCRRPETKNVRRPDDRKRPGDRKQAGDRRKIECYNEAVKTEALRGGAFRAAAERKGYIMDIRFNLFPGGRDKALTMSYDDGRTADRRLVEIFNANGIRGTFHLNSEKLDTPDYISAREVKALYQGHEIAAHTCTHPFLGQLPERMQLQEILGDRERLEELAGYPVTGMSWPYGSFSDDVIRMARACGIVYSRTVHSTGGFDIPADFMRWDPTAHHGEDLDRLWERFQDAHRNDMRLFYIWGHSYEFDLDHSWERMEAFCEKAGGHADVWYATNGEIKAYLDALHSLAVGARMDMIHNGSAVDVWVSVEGKPVRIGAGELWKREGSE